jgi:carbon-monoxide dehydrogenase large subunit
MIQGDTDKVATGGGTGGSSSIPCGGASLEKAVGKLATEIKKLAADALEASSGDLEIDAGTVRVAGTDRVVSFEELAAKANEQIRTADVWTPDQPTYPNGTHIAEVEVDEATGHVDIVNYAIVDDFGMTLNPLMLAGQVHGGSVQGIGQALMENTAYDDVSGQLLSASLMDYALPRASDSPAFAFETSNVPCKTNPLGVKGAGEAGAIGSCPAVMNAILDALWRADYAVPALDMPATPQRIWAAMENGRRAAQ